MSETKRRTKSTEENGSERPAAPRQTRVTLTKDVSSKYRKIMPRAGGGRKGGDGSAPPKRRERPEREWGARPEGGEARPRRLPGRSAGFGSGDRPARSFTGSSFGRPPRQASGGPSGAARRAPAGRPPMGRPMRDGLNPVALKAIVHRELPEAARQIQEIQDLLRATAEAMLGLTEQLGGHHDNLKSGLSALADVHQGLGDDFRPLSLNVENAQGAVTGLFEKMSFQDLVGQRLMKVDAFLKSLAEIMRGAPRPFAGERKAPRSFGDDRKKNGPRRDGGPRDSGPRKVWGGKSHLKGPQAAGGGLEQTDIDALMGDI